MRKLILVAAALAIGAAFLTRLIESNNAAIAQAEAEAARLTGERDSLIRVISERESRIASLGFQRDSSESLAASWRDSVAVLERDRAAAQLTIRNLHTVSAVQAELRASFPELGDSAWGITRIPLEPGDTLGIEYLVIPAWFAETFVIDHGNAESWREQKDRLLVADSLQLLVTALQDSIARLEKANTDAYQSGYQVAYASYQELSSRYVAELKKPRISFGSTIRFVAAAGVGILVGRAAR